MGKNFLNRMIVHNKTALISVWDKTGLPQLGKALVEMGFETLSTGGTARALEKEGIKITHLSDYTGFPEMLDGRVKSLHPKIHAGILALRNNQEHLAQLKDSGTKTIDVVVVNLYPFREKSSSPGAALADVLEFIDIGGVALIRAAAKNFQDVVVLTDPEDYGRVVEEMKREKGTVSDKTRRDLARKAFFLTAEYDVAIASFLEGEKNGTFPALLTMNYSRLFIPRYGENPHQRAAVYETKEARKGSSLLQARQLQGTELSYNNLLDLESALALVLELEGKAAVIIKHNNPCGGAESDSLLESYLRARSTDPVSAFGSIVAFNDRVDEKVAEEVTSTFVEAVIAPAYQPSALKTFSRKKKLRILEIGPLKKRPLSQCLRSIYGGLLLQDEDNVSWDQSKLEVVTKRFPDSKEWKDLFFAWKVSKHTRSNAVVLAREKQTIGIGAGQMSRIDAARLAVTKANNAGLEIKGAVLASDAFFPFKDVVDLAAQEGVTALVQPGGSIRDEESIRAADEHGLTLVFTGIRHFKH